MSFFDEKHSDGRNNAATLSILVIAALSLAVAPSFSASLMETAAAELPAIHVPNNGFISPDKIMISGAGDDNGNAPTNDNNNNNADDMNNTENTENTENTDNSWCYNQGTVTDENGNTKQITSCWNSEQECQDIQMVDQEATGDCFQNLNAQPDESTHNSWCYDAGPDPVEDKSCHDSQQECEQVQMNDENATTECSKVAGPTEAEG